MRLKTLGIFLLVLFAGCSTLQVNSDYDPAFDFATLKRFAVVYPKGIQEVSLTQTRIADALRTAMIRKGYSEVPKTEADFIMLFHTDVTTKQQVVTDYQTVGFYPYFGYGYPAPMSVPVQREYSYNEGKIIVDALNPKGNKIFWRAIATDRLKSFNDPQERIAYIGSVIDDMLKSFPDRR